MICRRETFHSPIRSWRDPSVAVNATSLSCLAILCLLLRQREKSTRCAVELPRIRDFHWSSPVNFKATPIRFRFDRVLPERRSKKEKRSASTTSCRQNTTRAAGCKSRSLPFTPRCRPKVRPRPCGLRSIARQDSHVVSIDREKIVDFAFRVKSDFKRFFFEKNRGVLQFVTVLFSWSCDNGHAPRRVSVTHWTRQKKRKFPKRNFALS